MDHEWRQRFGNALSSHNFAALAQLGRRYEGYSTNTFGARVGYAHRFLNQFEHDGGSPAIPPTGEHQVELHANLQMDGRTVAKSVGGDESKLEEVSPREAVSKQLSDLWGVDLIPQPFVGREEDDAAVSTDAAVSADTDEAARISEAGASIEAEMEAKFAEWSV